MGAFETYTSVLAVASVALDHASSVQSWPISLRAGARLGLVAPLLLIGAAAPAGLR